MDRPSAGDGGEGAAEDAGRRPGAKRTSFLLRLPPDLLDELRAWSAQEFRSINGQIEYLLREAVRRRRRGK